MAGKLSWTLRAQQDRYEILQFWINNNRSTAYSIRLNAWFESAAEMAFAHPLLGKRIKVANVRYKLIREYKMFYRIHEGGIDILSIYDGRRDQDFAMVDELR